MSNEFYTIAYYYDTQVSNKHPFKNHGTTFKFESQVQKKIKNHDYHWKKGRIQFQTHPQISL